VHVFATTEVNLSRTGYTAYNRAVRHLSSAMDKS